MAMMVLAGSVWGRDWAPALVSAQVGFHSRELWRGLRMTDGPVAVASASAWEGGFLLSGWLSVELDEGHVREADLTVERILVERGWGVISGGWAHYSPGWKGDTDELFLTYSSWNRWSRSRLIVTACADVHAGTGLYLVASGERELFCQYLGGREIVVYLTGSAGLCLGDGYVGKSVKMGPVRGLFDGSASLSATFRMRYNWGLTPEVGLSFPLGGDARRVLRERNGCSVSPWVSITLVRY